MQDWQRHSLTPWSRRKLRDVEPLGRQSTAEPKQEDEMKRLMAVAAMLFMMPVAAGAQDAIPALKGTWRGTGKILLFGTTEHLSGSPQNAVVRDLEVTHTVAGQDGRLIWGTTSSANNDSKEPFAWALSADNKTIEGADSDGYYRITIVSADRLEKCYVQNAVGPRHAIVATCFHDGSREELARRELRPRGGNSWQERRS